MLHFIDFEVTRFDWLCVIQDPIRETDTVIVNDPYKLRQYYDQFKSEIFIGYNIREYDSYIFKAILCGFNPWEMNDHIVNQHYKGYTYSSELNKFPLITYDIIQLNTSLKQLEAFQGHNIYESDVDFNIRRKLTPEEIEEMVSYCKNDVDETRELFLKLKGDFDVQMELIREFNLPLSYMGKTQSQLVAEIMGACKRYNADEDEFNLNFPPYLDKIKKYKDVVDFYKELATDRKLSDWEKKRIYEKKYTRVVAGVKHDFAWGGLHGALLKYSGEGIYLHIDVSQYYPSLTVGHNYFSRATSKEGKKRYDMMRKESIRLKKFPELKLKRAGYKLCNNKAYGCMKDKYNNLYDPLMANNICVTGQLALLLLIEMLEPYVQLIQSNTDGIIVKLDSLDDYELVDDICWEWEQMTKVSLAFDPIITKIYQKDVNNYLFINEDGDIESKGAYVKSLSALDNDLPIVNKAIVDYMVKGIPPDVTVNSCDELIMYQKIVKLSSSYGYVEHNGQKYTNKCYRVFASKDRRDGIIYKCRYGKHDKFGNTPEKCFIDNSNISSKSVPDKLDKNYYIELAKDRLIQFGLDEFKSQLEFKF